MAKTGVQIQVEELVRGCTTSMPEDKFNAVVNYILEARIKRTNASVWHAVAQVFRNGDRCNCAECSPPTQH